MSDAELRSIDAEAALRALAILSAADRAERDPEPRVATEVLLQKAGFSNGQIGAVVGEKSDTIRKRLKRAEKAESKPSGKAKRR